MVFSSSVFLFLFLPVMLLVYFLAPERWRNYTLFFSSLIFYAWSGIKFLLFLVLSLLWNYFGGIIVGKRDVDNEGKSRKLLLFIFISGHVLFLFFFKYMNFFADIISSLGLLSLNLKEIVLPVGISFYTFQEISYLVDIYRGEKPQNSVIDLGCYIVMVPQLIAGPIVRYSQIKQYLTERNISFDDFTVGFERFILGLCKKVILANQLGVIVNDCNFVMDGSATMVTAWLLVISYSLQLYYDFSGYSDMAIGLGRMLGFHFSENFNYPYMASSFTDFWRRWHISLSFWFRDYIYIPLGGSRVKVSRHIINLFIVWFLTGLWHGASWNFILWGLIYFVLIVLEKYLIKPEERESVLFRILYRIFTVLIVILNFALFRYTIKSDWIRFFKKAFGLGGAAFINTYDKFLLRENVFLLIFAFIFAAPVVMRLKNSERKTFNIIYKVGFLLAAVLAFSFVFMDAYNPFLYFQF